MRNNLLPVRQMSTSLSSDFKAYQDKVYESVEPLIHQLDPIQSYRPNACFSAHLYNQHRSAGISLPVANQPSLPQQVIDIDSALSGRNVIASSDKMANYTQIALSNYVNPIECSDAMAPIYSQLEMPKSMTRGQPMSRFYESATPYNPAENIYWDRAQNTVLYERDNFSPLDHIEDTLGFVEKGNLAMINRRQKTLQTRQNASTFY